MEKLIVIPKVRNEQEIDCYSQIVMPILVRLVYVPIVKVLTAPIHESELCLPNIALRTVGLNTCRRW